MDKSVKHFVRRILAINLLLLALLLAVVIAAARHVYNSARIQALDQARVRQTLLAEQTAHGAGGFYDSILSDLNLLKSDDEEVTDLPDLPEPSPEARPLPTFALVRQALGALLVRQLEGRARLFMVDERMQPRMLGIDDKPLKLQAASARNSTAATAPATAINTFEQHLAALYGDWLKGLKEPAISALALVDEREIKLIALPLITGVKFGAGARATMIQRRVGWLVAAVSARPVERNYLVGLGLHGVSGAFLVDENMRIMASSRHELVGTRLGEGGDPQLNQALADFAPENYSATKVLSQPFHVGALRFEPSMVSACPVKVLGNRWIVVMTSPLKDVDAVVTDLAGKALFWAIFVAVSMTAILVTTAAQLILSRMKMERLRHQSLQNEMRQARKIQLAWLPEKTKTTCGAALLDIATLNRPANHISGDFYNFFELPDGRTAVLIGDVTGHGMSAAFLMATTQLLLRNTLPQFCDPGRCLEDVNRQLTNQVFNGQFVTMQILVIDSQTGEVAISTAGHPNPMVSDGDSFKLVDLEPQLVAGVDSTTPYHTERFHLRPGSSLLLYTDGVIEAENSTGDRLRTEGLRKALNGQVKSAEDLLQNAVSAVNTFRRGEILRDDLTLVAIHLFAKAKASPQHGALPAAIKTLQTAQR
ncbi:MAG TPA: PP2C family protein-serine/threonine phosphatase [Tepidisphaeraceae bacterium]|jgi:serine phosphatase RsbU (regulator of sigma subunit)|nr:PP2C family protein-serine/threonine phosphatase [Tepidisphaeraceae bacterium]